MRDVALKSREAAVALGVCCVRDCGNVASVESVAGNFCRRCWEEIDALRAQAARKREKERLRWKMRESQAQYFARTATRVKRALDWVLAGLIAAAVVFLGWVYWAAFLQWMGWQ